MKFPFARCKVFSRIGNCYNIPFPPPVADMALTRKSFFKAYFQSVDMGKGCVVYALKKGSSAKGTFVIFFFEEYGHVYTTILVAQSIN